MNANEGTPIHILVVDDDEDTLFLIRKMLEKIGHRVTATPSAEEALVIFNGATNNFNLVLTDMVMPGIDGCELARRINEIDAQIPIVLITGYGPEDLLPNMQSCEIRKIVYKPFTVEELKTTVAGVVELSIGDSSFDQPLMQQP
ncbi:MAG: response regulator [Desulfobacterales bacterium]